MRYRHLLLLLPLAALLVVSCGRVRPVTDMRPDMPDLFPHHQLNEIRFQLIRAADHVHAFHARASLVVSSPRQNGRFSADLRFRRSDSLYLSLSPGLGIEAARALVTPDSVFIYDRIHNELTYGSVDEAVAFMGLPVSEDDLFLNLLGLIVPEPDIEWEVRADTTFYYLTSPSGRMVYVVDPARWRVVRYEEVDSAGSLLDERVFSEFDLVGGTFIPRRVVFRRPLERATASLYYRDLDLAPGPMSFDLRIRDSARRVQVGG
jgi:hypothetical protein